MENLYVETESVIKTLKIPFNVESVGHFLHPLTSSLKQLSRHRFTNNLVIFELNPGNDMISAKT